MDSMGQEFFGAANEQIGAGDRFTPSPTGRGDKPLFDFVFQQQFRFKLERAAIDDPLAGL